MASEWQTVRIDELCQGIYDGPHATPEKTTDGPIFLGISNLSNGRIDLSNAEHLSEEDFLTWTRRVTPQENDVVFSYETRLGEAARIPAGLKCCLGRRMALMRPHPDKVDSRFLLYAFLSPTFQEVIRTRTVHGSTVDRLALIEFPGFPLTVPSDVEEQRAIADILGSLDDKIELNRRMNATLEETARALFKSWFVDFDPVRAKMEGREPVGMDAETAALFPDRLVESELGPIPDGWRIDFLSNLCNVARGGSPRPINDYMDGTVPWVKIADATSANGPFLFETKERLKEAGVSKSVFLRKGALILSNSATTGLPIFLEIDGCVHDGWLYFQDLRHISTNYLYYLLLTISEHLTNIADGTVQRNLNTTLVGSQKLIIPDTAIVNCFDRLTMPLLDKVKSNGHQSRLLASIRDALLPKLLSGEVRVEGVDDAVAIDHR